MQFYRMAAATVLAASGSTIFPADQPPLLERYSSAAQTCDDVQTFRAGVPIVSADPARPGIMGIVMGSLKCVSSPEPDDKLTTNLAYMVAQLAPAHVFDQLQRTRQARPEFGFAYGGMVLEMQQAADTYIDRDSLTNHVMLCHAYNYVSRLPEGQFVASGNINVCLPEHRFRAGNLPPVPLDNAMRSTPPQRSHTEPRDPQYYDPGYRI